MPTTVQIPSWILPHLIITGLETETIGDLVEHTSIEFPVEYLQEKQIHIVATEVVAAGVPGPLWCWVELSPFPSVNNLMHPAPLPATTAYWAAIGGGGGALAPVAPLIEAGIGVTGTVHTILMPWAIHSSWARVVIQTPVAAALPLAGWIVQVMVSGKAV